MDNVPQKLTKKFLMSLPAEKWIVSNVMNDDATPVFVGEVKPLGERETQWTELVACGVAQRQCHVFDSRANYIKWWGAATRVLPDDIKDGGSVKSILGSRRIR